MATETVIYVSLALVLLTRIYVFISPPEFLEEHKDRRYHEYHLYRQYHLHKQYDQNDLNTEQLHKQQQQHHHEEQDESVLSTKQEKVDGPKESSLNGLHHPSDELVLLGMGPGARPFPLRELSTQALSKLSPMAVSPTTTTSATSHSTVREKNERHIWNHILGSSDDLSVPNYLSLDTTEIHYNGSLDKFEQDPEVHEAIRELKAGQRDMAKECPVMTAVWEGGRWCCLEGRTLYILQALNWQGQVRVRVLVDKSPTTLAVTEECWKAAGMASDMSARITTANATTTSTITTTTATTAAVSSNSVQSLSSMSLTGGLSTESVATHSVYFNRDAREPRTSRVRISAASAVANSLAVGLSLEEGSRDGAVTHEAVFHVNSGLLVGESTSRSGSPAGHEADDEEEEDEDSLEDGIDSEGYMEDDEGDLDEDEDEFPSGLERKRTLSGNSSNSMRPLNLRRRRRQTSMSHSRAHRNFQSHVSPLTPPSPLLLPNKDLIHPSQPSSFALAEPISGRETTFGTTESPNKDDINHSKQQKHEQQHYQQQQHERKISIPEFLLPPPLHDEQVYLIVDSSCDGPPRRDSGHGDST
ncbi:hypothetical protein BG011_002572 [Mortierella polycephala]|uniref:Uncharacterized protein n=1 Tax=Mortierella polycephala TaxID=41804 RepID=A0A9P6U4M1_9FUNG|nr:hypothetical protein BG011_002572 [Mortierella polycephala]